MRGQVFNTAMEILTLVAATVSLWAWIVYAQDEGISTPIRNSIIYVLSFSFTVIFTYYGVKGDQ